MNEENKPKKQISIEIDEATSQGAYSNLAMVTHSETEFVIDFLFNSPQPPKAKVRSRIITSPVHMKKFLMALQENISRYESRFGPIKASPSEKKVDPTIGFYH